MADQEHVELLRRGVASWNAWRNDDPDVKPFLAGADLRGLTLEDADLRATYLLGATLAGAQLARANLSHATLAGCDLAGADLRGAILRNVHGSANLSGCDLSGADLEKAYLREANLENADLSDTNLVEAKLSGANLRGAKFSRARLRRTDLSGADLTEVDLSPEFSQAVLGGDIDFAGACLQDAKLWQASLRWTNFAGADLRRAYLGGALLWESNFTNADLRGAFLDRASLQGADLSGAKLAGTNLSGSFLKGTNLSGADLAGANLEGAQLLESNVEDAELSGSHVYGISVWGVRGVPKAQTGLVITPGSEAAITVDDLEVAQFIYLLLNRAKLRNVIDSITSKAVLILGRFTSERKAILDGLADEIRNHNLLPIIFDFERSTSRDVTETIKTLAGLSLFVIADITNPKSSPLELQATVPDYQIPFVQIIEEGQEPFSMFADLANKYSWVLRPVLTYKSLDDLLKAFKVAVLDRVWEKHRELEKKKAEALDVRSIGAFLHDVGEE